MVFSFRKRRIVPMGEDPSIRTTPSLPDFSSSNEGIGQAIAWPSSFVDEVALKSDEMPEQPAPSTSPAPGKISFSQSKSVSFHRPFKGNDSPKSDQNTPDAASPAPSSWNRASTLSIRKRSKKGNPTFNLMVSFQCPTYCRRRVNGRVRSPDQGELGKTSLLRLLLATSDLSPALQADTRSALESFLTAPLSTTAEISELSVELLDGLLLTVVDTPGLDYREGRELVLESQVNSITREIERRYGDSVVEESRVVRSKGAGKHIHL